jgi:DNA helicase-2/ATP-dependent DNA helicase PcrA
LYYNCIYLRVISNGSKHPQTKRNQDQIKKIVWTENGVGKPISVVRTLTDNEEGRVIAHKIFDLHSRSNVKN